MKKLTLTLVLLFSLAGWLKAQYLNQQLPGETPVVFAPGMVSLKDHYEYGSFFSKDGKEFYYAVTIHSKPQIRCMRLEKGSWTKPEMIIGNDRYDYNDPFISPDGKRLYFISDQPIDGQSEKKDFDIWYLERKGNGWSEIPVNAGPAINSAKNEYYMSFTSDGTMYFSSNRDKDYNVYSSRYVNGTFQAAQKLPDAVNTEHYEADVFVSADEQYVIFCGEHPDGYGQGDLYISFKNPAGEWQKAKNLGKAINSKGYEFCPFVTSDGKYLFFSRDGDIFWVKATFLKKLR